MVRTQTAFFLLFKSREHIADHKISGEIAAKFANGLNWGNTAQIFPWWIGSVSEAVFYVGMERNGDKIIGSAYVRNSQLYFEPRTDSG